MKVYSLNDLKLEYFSEPFIAFDDKSAISALRDACAAPNGIFLRARIEQSALFCVGDFDPCTGVIDPVRYKVCDGCSIPFYASIKEVSNDIQETV